MEIGIRHPTVPSALAAALAHAATPPPRLPRRFGRASALPPLLYVREDNAFLEPPAQLATFAAAHFRYDVENDTTTLSGRGVAAVDNQCGWGSFSDKIYLLDASGAKALFGADEPSHVERMAAWVQLAMLPPDAPQRLRKLSSPDLTLARPIRFRRNTFFTRCFCQRASMCIG